MKNKTQRQLAIKKTISATIIDSQEQLLAQLIEQGYELTQATLSRDLRTLKVAKVPNGKNAYRYIIPENTMNSEQDVNINFLVDGFREIKFSGNLAVIKTKPGFANSIAVFIDNSDPFEVLGTIAGDDTILLIMREGITQGDLVNSLILIMPNLQDKISRD